ncbi:DinB family protein [Fictibacillus enclensis]|uniref:DinB family protein n=1 Tax=Fictibacillus enclensis TaxID=1017270 RepID=UPI0025A1090F|nr:DinB family protein [Fictibacillus enclensis]MDM5338410.1 DinB family protein [Fictibacillus enclensis]
METIEYEWVKQTRKIMLDVCGNLTTEMLTANVEGFGYPSIRNLLVHTADCYYAWLGSFLLLRTKTPLTPKDKFEEMSLNDIRERFSQVDLYVKEIWSEYDGRMEEPVNRIIPWRDTGESLSMTPRQLLFHTVTHEFHHKGQVMAMMRRLGMEPPNTDVLVVGEVDE